MKKIIFLTIFLTIFSFSFSVVAQANQVVKYYDVYLSSINESLKYTNIVVRAGEKEIKSNTAENKATLFSFSGEELVFVNFDTPKEGEQYILTVPYYPKGKEIKITNSKGTELLIVKVASFAKTCPDGICQEHESFVSCSDDCSSGSADGYCDGLKDGKCDPDCETEERDVDCSEENIIINNNKDNVDKIINKDNNIPEKTENRLEKENQQSKSSFIFILIIGVILVIVLWTVMRLRKQ